MLPPTSLTGLLLLCVDMQPVFIDALPDGAAVAQRCRFAIETACGLKLPVAFTEQVPQKLGGTSPALLADVERPLVWSKSTFSAMADDGIRDALREHDIEHVLLCGIETSVCVYQTALDALDAQLQITVLSDCVSARRPADAQIALAALCRLGVHVLPAETVFYALLHDAKHPFFKAYTQLVKKYG